MHLRNGTSGLAPHHSLLMQLGDQHGQLQIVKWCHENRDPASGALPDLPTEEAGGSRVFLEQPRPPSLTPPMAATKGKAAAGKGAAGKGPPAKGAAAKAPAGKAAAAPAGKPGACQPHLHLPWVGNRSAVQFMTVHHQGRPPMQYNMCGPPACHCSDW